MARSHRLFLLRELVRRDFTQRYAGSLLGLLWSLLQPLWQLLLLSFVFSIVMRIPLTGEPTDRFWVFLLAGLLPWLAVQEGIQRGTTAITDQGDLVKKIRFPATILVVTVVTTALLHEAIIGGLYTVALIWVGELSVPSLPLLAVALTLQVLLTLGFALLLAPLHVFLRDTAQLVGMALSAWFYLTPIVYPLSLVPERFQPYVQLNPLTALVGLYRRAFLGGETLWPPGMPALVALAVGSFIAGLVVFRRLRPGFADEL